MAEAREESTRSRDWLTPDLGGRFLLQAVRLRMSRISPLHCSSGVCLADVTRITILCLLAGLDHLLLSRCNRSFLPTEVLSMYCCGCPRGSVFLQAEYSVL